MSDDLHSGSSPYRGLQPYTAADRAFFFGRERDQQIIVSNLYAASLTILYGGSGVGKSSVLLAGVVPQLTEAPRLAVVAFRHWQADNFLTSLKADVLAAVNEKTGKNVAVDLNLPLDELIQQCNVVLRGPIFFILDQFEEYFLYHPDCQDGNTFDAELAQAINRPEVDASFIFSMREDGLSKLDRFQGRIPSLLNNLLRLEHLDRQAATDAICKPLAEYNRRQTNGQPPFEIEPELVTALLDQLRAGKVTLEFTGQGQIKGTRDEDEADARIETPFLQMVLSRLWEKERLEKSNKLRKATLEELGGPENIARSHLDKQLAKFKEAEREMTAELLRYLVTPSGTKIAQECSSLASWASLDEKRVERLLNRLSSPEMRILRTVSAPGQPVKYEIFHDVLARAVVSWRARRRLLAESRRARLWRVGVRLLALTILMLIAAGISWRKGIKTERLVERADQLAESSSAERADPELQLLLAVEAVKIMPTENARKRLIQALSSPMRAILHGHEGPVRAAVFSRDGKWIATASEDKTVRIWSRENLYDTSTIRHPNFVMNVAFSPDSKLVVTACKDGIARVYSMGSWTDPVAELKGHQKSVRSAVFSPDGKSILTGGEDNTARVWRQTPDGKWETGLQLGEPSATSGGSPTLGSRKSSGHANFVQSARFSPDGKFIVTGSRDNMIKVWQADTGKLLQTLPDENVVRDVTFSPDGQAIVSGNESCQIKVWRRNGDSWGRLAGTAWAPDQTLPEQGCREDSDEYQHGYIDGVNFDPKGQVLLSASRDHRVFLRDTQTWRKQGEALVGHNGEVYSADFSADGNFIVSASEDGNVIFWEPRPVPIPPETPIDELLKIASGRLFRALDCNELRRFQLPCQTSTAEDCCLR